MGADEISMEIEALEDERTAAQSKVLGHDIGNASRVKLRMRMSAIDFRIEDLTDQLQFSFA